MLVKCGTTMIDPAQVEAISADEMGNKFEVSIFTKTGRYTEEFVTFEEATAARDAYSGIVNDFYGLSQSFGGPTDDNTA